MNSKLIITAEEAMDLHGGKWSKGKVSGEYTWATEQEGDSGRWTQYITVIFKDASGAYWAFDYEYGLTEYQENIYPWDDSSEVECYRVEPYVVTKVEYRRL